MATEKVTITLNPSQKEKAFKDSEKLFGNNNVSGYIGYLINNQREATIIKVKRHARSEIATEAFKTFFKEENIEDKFYWINDSIIRGQYNDLICKTDSAINYNEGLGEESFVQFKIDATRFEEYTEATRDLPSETEELGEVINITLGKCFLFGEEIKISKNNREELEEFIKSKITING